MDLGSTRLFLKSYGRDRVQEGAHQDSPGGLGRQWPARILKDIFHVRVVRELAISGDQMVDGEPVDLAQSVIGSGMAVFSRYAKVVEPDGSDMTVRRALELINNSVQSYMVERGVSMDLFFLNVS